jgi:hypothetical protein
LVPFDGWLDLLLTRAVAIFLDCLVDHLLAEFATRRGIHVLVWIVPELGLRITEIETSIPHLVDCGDLAFIRTTLDVLDTIHDLFLYKKK